MQFTDAVTVAGTRRTGDGYLIADAKAVRTGIQLYAGSEVGKPEMAVVRVYRSEGEVRSADSLRSFSHAPVTVDHPAQAVTADNWKQLAVGEVSTAATWDGNRISLPLILKEASAIEVVNGGKRELSAGYTCDLVWEGGKTADGQSFDAQQKNIRANHVAIVDRGRAGSECRIGDGAPWGASPLTEDSGLAPITKSKQGDDMSDALKTVVLGDKAVQVAVTDVAAIEAFKADSAKALTDVKAAHDAALATKDAELAKKDAKIADLEKQVLTPDAIDAKVQARADLIDAAKKVAPKIETKGLSDAAIRRAAVVAVRGEDAVKDKSEAYIDAAFDWLMDAKPADPLGKVLQSGIQTGDGLTSDAAYKQMLERDRNAWQGQKETA
jgi:hypothetical protein